jgi:glyoxylase-like metal-dependent hydrolase (beta-lactamase superfamily II)
MTGFAEVATDVYVLRQPVLDVNATLVLGGERALVVDTLSTDTQAAQLREAVRRITSEPLCVVNTHHHFDHWFGNGVLAREGAEVWAHEEAAARLSRRTEELRRHWVSEWARVEPDLAAGMASATLRLPDRTVHIESIVDLGGRTVVLHHFGRGHTDGDLVVHVPDADAVLAGDLVEEAGPPSFEDSYPLEWPETLAALLRLTAASTVVVPGHGAPVDARYVHGQHDQLTALAWLIRGGHYDGATEEAVAAKAPFDAATARVAVHRGYAELSGRA